MRHIRFPKKRFGTVDREAHAWVRRLTSGDATAEDAEALRRWYRESTAHAEAFARASRLWGSFGPAGQSLLSRSGSGVPLPAARSRYGVSRRLVIGGFAAAGAAAGIAVLHPPMNLWPSWSDLGADFRTATGEQRRIALDSVSVDLNTQTSIAVQRLNGEISQMELITGEASITTARDATRPFTVVAAGGRTSARQARFDVRHTGPRVHVTCLEGEVRVEHRDRALTVPEKQQVTYDDHVLGDAVAIDPAIAAAWQEGLLVFRYTPLSEVIEEVNRYRPGRIFLLDAERDDPLVNGRFRIDRIDDVLVQIQQAFGLKVTSLPGGVVFLS